MTILAAVVVLPATASAGQLAHRPDIIAARATPQAPAAQEPVDLLWRTAEDRLQSEEDRLQSWVGVNVGADQEGDLTFDGRARFFTPFGQRSGVQIEGSYNWYHQRREGQLDVALVRRVDRVQLGLFSSVRWVNLKVFESGGRALSQAGGTLDYVFATGRIGLFGTAALRDRTIVRRQFHVSAPTGQVLPNVLKEEFLHLVDQAGASGQLAIRDRAVVEGYLSFLKPSGRGRTTGGSLRVIYPVAATWAITGEASWNPYLIAQSTESRVTIGMQMARFRAPARTPADERPIPIEIPAIRYEVLNRPARIGNDSPIADAGPDRTIVVNCPSTAPCSTQVTLDASGSRDPDGDPMTFRWTRRSGFADNEQLTSPDAKTTTFVGTADHTYVVRLQVSDDRGAVGLDEVVIAIRRQPQVASMRDAR